MAVAQQTEGLVVLVVLVVFSGLIVCIFSYTNLSGDFQVGLMQTDADHALY